MLTAQCSDYRIMTPSAFRLLPYINQQTENVMTACAAQFRSVCKNIKSYQPTQFTFLNSYQRTAICIHVSIINWMNEWTHRYSASCYVGSFLALRKTKSGPVVFATAPPIVKPLRNTWGGLSTLRCTGVSLRSKSCQSDKLIWGLFREL